MLPSGTDRVAAALGSREADFVVNLQGDEPLLPPSAIDALVLALKENSEVGMATLAVPQSSEKELQNLNTVKVLLNEASQAVYFSRQPLATNLEGHFLKHIGVYAFRRQVLNSFCRWEPSALEKVERLEQLRAIEKGIRIQVILVEQDTIAVDQREDIAKVEAVLLRRGGAIGETELPQPKDQDRDLSS